MLVLSDLTVPYVQQLFIKTCIPASTFYYSLMLTNIHKERSAKTHFCCKIGKMFIENTSPFFLLRGFL